MSLRIIDPGLYTLLVDFGRPRYRSLGVPVGGAADRTALVLGNALVGNPPDTPALEITLAGPTLMAACELACVIHGAPFDLTCAGRRPRAGTTFTLPPEVELHIGAATEGMRAYLCVRGGFLVPKVLGSASGLEPLKAGTELPCAPGRIHGRYLAPTGSRSSAEGSATATLRVIDGAQADWFPDETFLAQDYRVSPSSNRMGLRLEGQALPMPARELVSEPVCPGAVQVTRDGQCIILGVDGQTIGGYPKIAQVISADLDTLGQLRPGTRLRFQKVNLEEAESLYRRKQVDLGQWLTRLELAEQWPAPEDAPAHEE